MAAMNDGKPPDHTSLPRVGRPKKSPHEKRRKQQQATKWRDARRVYLGNSCDRWKKLKARIGLKDNSLAWHLMEAHSSHCVECGKGTKLLDEGDDTPRDFYPQLIKSIRRICLQYIGFQHTVEVVGLVCLEIDKGTKENFSIREVVTRPIGLRVEALVNKHKTQNLDRENSIDDDYDDDDDEYDDDERMDDEVDEVSDSNEEFEDGEEPGLWDQNEASMNGVGQVVTDNAVSLDLADVSNEKAKKTSCDTIASSSSEVPSIHSNPGSPYLPQTSPMQSSPPTPSQDSVSDSAELSMFRVDSDAASQDARMSPDIPRTSKDEIVFKSEEMEGAESFLICRNSPELEESAILIGPPKDRSLEKLRSASTPEPSEPSGETVTDQQTSPIDLKVVKEEPKDLAQTLHMDGDQGGALGNPGSTSQCPCLRKRGTSTAVVKTPKTKRISAEASRAYRKKLKQNPKVYKDYRECKNLRVKAYVPNILEKKERQLSKKQTNYLW